MSIWVSALWREPLSLGWYCGNFRTMAMSRESRIIRGLGIGHLILALLITAIGVTITVKFKDIHHEGGFYFEHALRYEGNPWTTTYGAGIFVGLLVSTIFLVLNLHSIFVPQRFRSPSMETKCNIPIGLFFPAKCFLYRGERLVAFATLDSGSQEGKNFQGNDETILLASKATNSLQFLLRSSAYVDRRFKD